MTRRRRSTFDGFDVDLTRCEHPAHQDYRQRAINELRPIHGLLAVMVRLECGCMFEAHALG